MRVARRSTSLVTALTALAVTAGLGIGSRADAITAPEFTNFTSPATSGQAGEPTIGINPATDAVMAQSGLVTYRVENFNAATADADWHSVGPVITSRFSLDPILFTDPGTGRTFVSQLTAACSLLAYTDDDGASWVQNPVGCGLATAPDHQSVAGGPLAPPLGPTPVYEHAVYYCAQAIVTALCARSLDGGLTFGPGIPLWTGFTCLGGHGHVTVGPDGLVAVPHGDCGQDQAVIVSEDGGITWEVRKIPHAPAEDDQAGDPTVAIGPGGTMYFGYRNETNGRAYATVSTDGGRTWTSNVNVANAVNVRNVKFPTMVVGDDDRAAFAFLGTTTGGNDQFSDFDGEWHLYVATTYDRGTTWTTVKATTHPVQLGPICMGGISCPSSRNLLDFMDVAVDSKGKIYVAYSDGCLPGCTTVNSSRSDRLVIAKQTGGTDLIR